MVWRESAIGFADALKALKNSMTEPGHVFWPLDRTFAEIDEDIRVRIAGHHQIADGLLLDLAIRSSGRLATFDRRFELLLPENSVNRTAIEILDRGYFEHIGSGLNGNGAGQARA